MQYVIYQNTSKTSSYPYLVDVQSDIIDQLSTRLVIPMLPISKLRNKQVKRLNPIIEIEGNSYLVMTHEMASVPLSLLGKQVMDARAYCQRIKDSIDFIFDGF